MKQNHSQHHESCIAGGTLHGGMEGRSAPGICNLFNASAAGWKAGFLAGLFSLLGFSKQLTRSK